MHIAVLGAGAWGTALANLLCRKGFSVHLWARENEVVSSIRERHENTLFLPNAKLCSKLLADQDPNQVLKKAEIILVVIPSQFLRVSLTNLRGLLPKNPIIVCASKGIELDTLEPMSMVVTKTLTGMNPRYAVLSGPSFAHEVSRDMPTSVTLGCKEQELGRTLQTIFSTALFRVYTNDDFRGVEIGGAVKNVMAIAAGISDGLGFGHNARAALITRGLAEMSRLGLAMGAQTKTFMGLSGIGDLVLTCTGDLSRNRRLGFELGKGKKLASIIAKTNSIVEGVYTTKSVYDLSQKLRVELPITEQIYRILYEAKDPAQAVRDLMARRLKHENEEEV